MTTENASTGRRLVVIDTTDPTNDSLQQTFAGSVPEQLRGYASNSDGEFDVRLPAGQYIASTASNGRVQRFEVKAAGESRIELHTTAITLQPTNVPLRTVVAKVASTRAKNLHSYSWADGMRWGNVVGIAQAADGAVWLAGDVGLARFDGRSMTTIEEKRGKRLRCQAIAILQHTIGRGVDPTMGAFADVSRLALQQLVHLE